LDRAAEILQQRGLCGLLHGGRSSVLAVGHPPGCPEGWCVAIRHPLEPERVLAQVQLRDNALGTSASTFRHLTWGNRQLGHILDPRTGWPASGMLSATAIAPTAAEADALATAFFVLGTDKVRQFCASHPGISAILLAEGESTPTWLPAPSANPQS
jgi:thiamine biosynthesis lipoprotein